MRRSLRDFVDASGLSSLVLGTSKDPNAKVTILLVSPLSGRPVFAVKVPTTDVAARAVAAESSLLLELQQGPTAAVGETIPKVVEHVEHRGWGALVATALPGAPMARRYYRRRHTASAGHVAADFAAAERWLRAFQDATVQGPAPLEFEPSVSTRLRARFADDPELEADLLRLDEIAANLGRNVVPQTAVHGDLWFGNLLTVDGRVTGVVDWEGATAQGGPIRDVVRFALSYALYLDRRTHPGRRVSGHPGLTAGAWGGAVEFALEGSGWFPQLFRRFIQDGLAGFGASPASWRGAVLAGIAEVAALTDDQQFATLHLELFRRVAVSRRPEGGQYR
jgi:hypothetical protein